MTLFKRAKGSVLKGYSLLRKSGGNIPISWYERYCGSRYKKHKEVALILKKKFRTNSLILREWEEAYKKECFYYGIRILFELEREGKTKL